MRKLEQHVLQPSPWFHEVGFAAGNHRHQDRSSVAGGLAADEHPVFSSYGHRAHRPFGRVVIDRQVAVFEIAIQRSPLVERVRGRFARQALR